MYEDRILCPQLREKIMTAEQAADLIKSEMVLGYSGFSVGYPREVPLAIYEKGKARDLTIICGAATVCETFRATGTSGAVKRFIGFQFLREIRDEIAAGNIEFLDMHLSQLPSKLRRGDYGSIDYSIIECVQINADGSITPSTSSGIVNALVEYSDKLILEVNTAIPAGMSGMHDFGTDSSTTIENLLDRIGQPYIPCPPEKIAAIVITTSSDVEISFRDPDETSKKMGENVVQMLKKEIADGRLPKDFTLQVGTGNVAGATLMGLKEGGFSSLKMFTEVFNKVSLEFLDSGLFTKATTTCLDLTSECMEHVMANIDHYKESIVIRPLDVTNDPRRIADMGLVAMNTAVECDIYGNVNSSHAMGVNMINGIGGSNDFSRSALLSVFITPSTLKDGNISSIVPMVSHVDSTEHDTDIIVTEWGWADLRGLSPKERAKLVIENCAHPDYRPLLRKYYEDSLALCGPCQTPHDLSQAFSFHLRYTKTGTMLES